MTDLFLPTIPRGPMYIGDIMAREWQNFFRDLFNRVGGEAGPVDLDDLAALIASGALTTPPALEARLLALERAQSMSPEAPVGYGKRLEALERRFGSLPLPTVGLARRIEALERGFFLVPEPRPELGTDDLEFFISAVQAGDT